MLRNLLVIANVALGIGYLATLAKVAAYGTTCPLPPDDVWGLSWFTIFLAAIGIGTGAYLLTRPRQ